jgi:hypothetical protein
LEAQSPAYASLFAKSYPLTARPSKSGWAKSMPVSITYACTFAAELSGL